MVDAQQNNRAKRASRQIQNLIADLSDSDEMTDEEENEKSTSKSESKDN